jgi:hypothetical protein
MNMSVFQRKNVNSKDELQNIDGNDVWKNVKNENDKMTLNAEDELQNIDGNVRKNVKNNDHGFIEKGDQRPQDYHEWERQRREAERVERRRHQWQDGTFGARHAQQVAARRALLSEEQRQEQRRRHAQQVAARRALLSEDERQKQRQLHANEVWVSRHLLLDHQRQQQRQRDAQQVAARRALLSEDERQKQRQLHANEVWVSRHLLLDHQRQQQRQRDAQQVAARRAARRAILTEKELEQQRRRHAEDERLRLIRHSHPNCDEEVRRWHPHYDDEQMRHCILTEYLSGDFRISDEELLLENEYVQQLHARWDAEDAARREQLRQEQLSPEHAQQEAERQQDVQLLRNRELAIHLARTKDMVRARY